MPVRRHPTLRPTTTGLVVLALTVLGARVLRDHPSGWLRLVLAGGVVLLVLDLAWSFWGLRRLRIDLEPAPVGIVGRPLPSRLVVRSAALPVRVRMLSVDRAPEVIVHAPAEGTYAAVPDRRGAFPAATVRTLAVSPLGLLAGGWTWSLAFTVPVAVGPAPVAVTVTGGPNRPDAADDGTDLRGVRPYAPGDRRSLVHWPASARAGHLVVRQVTDPVPAAVEVVVDLGPAPGPGAERAAAIAAGLTAALEARGDRVLLVTATGAREVSGELDTAALLAHVAPGPAVGIGPATVFVVTPDGVEVVG